jgi:hypothetical protein
MMDLVRLHTFEMHIMSYNRHDGVELRMSEFEIQ